MVHQRLATLRIKKAGLRSSVGGVQPVGHMKGQREPYATIK